MVSGATHMSLVEVLDHSIVKRLEAVGDYEWLISAVSYVGYTLIGLIILYLIWTWRRADVRHPDFGVYYALVTSATLIISLHTQYYDAALLILPLLLILSDSQRRGRPIGARARLILAAAFLLPLPVYKFSEAPWMPFQLFFLLPVGMCMWAIFVLKEQRSARHAEPS